MKPLSLLPNQDGFRFIGILKSGIEVECEVVKNKDSGLHYVPGFKNLIGWADRAIPHQSNTLERGVAKSFPIIRK